MKLKNKKTGEIGEIILKHLSEYNQLEVITDNKLYVVKSLAELNAEWCDYEEPKEYWYIDPMVCGVYCTKIKKDEDLYNFNKEIGNYFDTREQAEKAVEKLKEFANLRKRGLKFNGWDEADRGQLGDIVIYAKMSTFEYDDDSTRDDLDILFGGEE